MNVLVAACDLTRTGLQLQFCSGNKMIKTKSLFDLVQDSDGTRIIVSGIPSRYPESSFDEFYPELAPTKKLLYDYKYHGLPWEEYEVQFFQLMKGHRALRRIEELAERSKKGEVITLLCFEKSDEKCHRRLLKNLIEELEKQN